MGETQVAERFSDDVFLAVPTASLLHYPKSISDVFVRLPSERMVKIARKGDRLDLEQIGRFGAKDVQVLYVFKTDFADVVSELVRGASAFGAERRVATDEKLNRFFTVSESVYAELLRLPLSDDAFSRTLQVTSEIATQMQQKPDFTKLIKSVVSLGDDFSRHSIGTVVMANMLMVPMDWTAKKLVDPVTMGAFFHDVGLKEVPMELRFKDRIEMTRDEAQAWEAHVGIGVHLLNSLNFITPEVLRIVQEHHETCNGTGFPGKLRHDRMFPMAKVVSFANVLAHDIFDSSIHGEPFSMDNLIKKIDFVYSVMYGSELSKVARRIFRKTDDKAA